VFAWRKKPAPVVEAMTFFERGYLTKKIPLSFGVAKNSGSAPLNSWESPVNLLDLEFLGTGSERYRYPLEKNGHGGNQARCKRERVHANTFERYQEFGETEHAK